MLLATRATMVVGPIASNARPVTQTLSYLTPAQEKRFTTHPRASAMQDMLVWEQAVHSAKPAAPTQL